MENFKSIELANQSDSKIVGGTGRRGEDGCTPILYPRIKVRR